MMLIAMLLALGLGQSIDTHEEAWAIANRNGITREAWSEVYADASMAVFVRNQPVGGESWIALVDADDLTVSLTLSSIDCARETWVSSQGSVRSWAGETIRATGQETAQIVPGSVGSKVYERFCPSGTSTTPGRRLYDGPPVIVPGPPRPVT